MVLKVLVDLFCKYILQSEFFDLLELIWIQHEATKYNKIESKSPQNVLFPLLSSKHFL